MDQPITAKGFSRRVCPVGHDQIRIDLHLHTQARACGARAKGAVEGERTRCQLFDGNAAVRAGKILREEHLPLPGTDVCHHDAAGERQRSFQGIRQAAADVLAQDQAVDDDLDGMLFLFGKGGRLGHVADLPIHAHAHKALFGDGFKHLDMLAFFPAHDGRQQLKPRAFGQGEHLIDHLIHRLPADLPAAFGAVRNAHARIRAGADSRGFP